MDDVEGAISRSAIDYDVLYIGIALPKNRLNGFFDGRGAVIDDGDKGDSQED